MVADQLNRSEGTQIQAVHYRGESPMWVDLASGQVQVAVGSYQSFATVASRGVKPIAVTGNYRSPKLPDVPTAQEQGAKGRLFALEGGLPLMAPAGTPEAVLQALSPQRNLEKGYAFLQIPDANGAGKVVTSIGQAEVGGKLEATLADGKLTLQVQEKQAS